MLTLTWMQLIVVLFGIGWVVYAAITKVIGTKGMHTVSFEIDKPSYDKASNEINMLHERVHHLLADMAEYNKRAKEQSSVARGE